MTNLTNENIDALSILHSVESQLDFELDMETADKLIEYLRDSPMSTDATYLIELFEL